MIKELNLITLLIYIDTIRLKSGVTLFSTKVY